MARVKCAGCGRRVPVKYFVKGSDYCQKCRVELGIEAAVEELKACRQCDVGKAAEEFVKARGKVTSLCKACNRRNVREWREKNSEKVTEYMRRYRATAAGRKKTRAANRASYHRNKL